MIFLLICYSHYFIPCNQKVTSQAFKNTFVWNCQISSFCVSLVSTSPTTGYVRNYFGAKNPLGRTWGADGAWFALVWLRQEPSIAFP